MLDLFFAEMNKPRSDNEKAFFAAVMASARAGHLCLDLDRVDDPVILSGAETALPSPYIRRQGRLVYLERNFRCEKEILEDLKRLSFPVQPPSFSAEGLTDEQQKAIGIALSNRLSVIEGGPGTGKTFLTSALVKPFSHVILAAPTGKAAARLKKFNPNATCSTLHAMLGFTSRRKSGYVKADLIIVDESSMIDAQLLAYFLRSLETGQRVVFLGDGHQLPPIESGSLFTDLIDLLPTAHLRQCLRSDRIEILQLAQDILDGKIISAEPLSEQRLLHSKAAILTPLREGPWGVNHLNELIFHHVQKQAQETWSVPILITKTNYEVGLYNGEMGTLWRTHEKPLYAEFDGRKIAASALPPYELGYVLSIHKSQGSEFDDVVVLVPPGTETFGREVLYTAVTRARNSVIICGDSETIQKTVSRSSQRNSGLKCGFV